MAEPEDADGGVLADAQDQQQGFFTEQPAVTSVSADLYLSFGATDWDADEVFAAAISGIADALLPGVFMADEHVHSDGDLSFRQDLEPPRLPIDRHGSFLAHKKLKERASKALGKATGRSTSRSPSRGSSRPQSRVSAALSGSILAMKMAKLAIRSTVGGGSTNGGGDAPFKINEWHDSASVSGGEKAMATGQPFNPCSGLSSSRYSLGSRGSLHTPPQRVDYQEVKRRELLSREIETRDGRERLTARLQRIGSVKLKLRSMHDPSTSVEREEREAAAKSRGGLRSRGSGQLTRINSVVGSVVDLSSRSNETTYRPEDYEDLHSEMVAMDKRGELVLGQDCHLVLRKSRSELQQDMYQRNTIKPRIHFPLTETAETENEPVARTQSPPRGASRMSSPYKETIIPQPIQQNPVFEGRDGTFEVYPRMELDPKKTPLAKGVKIIDPGSIAKPVAAVATTLSPLKEVQAHSKGKHKKLDSPVIAKLQLQEDDANASLEQQLQQGLRSVDKQAKPQQQQQHLQSAQPSARPTTRTTARVINTPGVAVLPRHATPGGKQQLQNLRLRTPAYGNRTGHLSSTGLDPLHDDESSNEWHEAVDLSASLHESTSRLPRSSTYMREFPSPPKGQIHVASPKAAAVLTSPSKASGGFPFSMLPSVIRSKR